MKKFRKTFNIYTNFGRPIPPPADGIEELTFDSPEAVETLENSEEGRSARTDLEEFVDTSRLGRIITKEIVIKDGPTHESMVKNIEFVTRKAGMPLSDFRHYWQNVHGPLAARIEVIKRYVQSHTLMSEYDLMPPPVYDGVAETWFENTGAMRHSATTPEYAAHHADTANFLEGALPFIITREIKII